MKTVDGLRAIRGLIETPDRWCTGSLAKDRDGDTVTTSNPCAYKFCLLGAIIVAGHRSSTPLGEFETQVEQALLAQIPNRGSLITFNDANGHAAVLNLIDAAIAAEEKEHG